MSLIAASASACDGNSINADVSSLNLRMRVRLHCPKRSNDASTAAMVTSDGRPLIKILFDGWPSSLWFLGAPLVWAIARSVFSLQLLLLLRLEPACLPLPF